MQNTEAAVILVTYFLSYQSAQGGGLGPGGFSCFYKRQITSLSLLLLGQWVFLLAPPRGKIGALLMS